MGGEVRALPALYGSYAHERGDGCCEVVHASCELRSATSSSLDKTLCACVCVCVCVCVRCVGTRFTTGRRHTPTATTTLSASTAPRASSCRPHRRHSPTTPRHTPTHLPHRPVHPVHLATRYCSTEPLLDQVTSQPEVRWRTGTR